MHKAMKALVGHGPAGLRTTAVVWISVALGATVSTLLIVSSLGKFLDIDSFAESLVSWSLFREPVSRWVVATVIPTVELSIGLCWMVNLWRRPMILCATMLIAIFSLAYLVEVFAGGRPVCSCFGVLLARQEREQDVWWIVARDAAMVVAGATSYWLSRRQ